MRVSAPTISKHRLHRLHRWMLLWLRWFAAFLIEARAFAPFTRQATTEAHIWLDRIERLLFNLILVNAAPRVRPGAPPKHAPRRRIESHMARAIIGASLRRALRPKDLSQRIAALSQDIEVLVLRILKRLPRGLTRRRPHPARPEARGVPCITAHAARAFRTDTS